MSSPRAGATPLRELAALFTRLGFTGFGNPPRMSPLMEDEVVRRRVWLSRERFLDLYGATNLIPGPNSTELAIHISHAGAGWSGFVVAGRCFILPAVAIVMAVALSRYRVGSLWLVLGGAVVGLVARFA